MIDPKATVVGRLRHRATLLKRDPINLVPDFIPVLGYLDDLILVPLGIALAVKMIPEPVLVDCRARALIASQRLWLAYRALR